jgi:hypothetical protein
MEDKTMRYPAMILALAGAALLTGCSSLVSLDPFVSDDQAVSDPNLAGIWQGGGGDDKDMMLIRQKGSAYTIRYLGNDNDASLGLEGRLTRVGDAELMDLVSTDKNAFTLPVHMVARVWTEGGGLKWVFLDSDWLKDQAKQTLGTQAAGDRSLITAKGAAVVEFLKKFGAGEKAYSGDMKQWVRAQ